jgi:hypothetical protein
MCEYLVDVGELIPVEDVTPRAAALAALLAVPEYAGDGLRVCDRATGQVYTMLLADGPACRVCGCTEHNACAGGCFWVSPDVCSGCFRAMTADLLL